MKKEIINRYEDFVFKGSFLRAILLSFLTAWNLGLLCLIISLFRKENK